MCPTIQGRSLWCTAKSGLRVLWGVGSWLVLECVGVVARYDDVPFRVEGADMDLVGVLFLKECQDGP